MPATEMKVPSGYSNQADRHHNIRFGIFTGALVTPVAVALGWHLVSRHRELAQAAPELLLWAAVLVFLNALDIRTARGARLAADVPIAAAACVLFDPLTAGLLVFVGSLDSRELKGETTLTMALANRSQVALGVILASASAQPWVHSRGLGSNAIACAVALAVWILENYLVVALGISLAQERPFKDSLASLRLGRTVDSALALGAWALIAYLQVTVYDDVGHWTVIAFSLLAVLARQVLATSDSIVQTEERVERQRQAIASITDRIADERKDERIRIASHLHDEVIQPLFQLSLLCEVAKLDLAAGRLLDLDEDVPALVAACGEATEKAREMVRDLRVSPLGSKGLTSTLRGLARSLQSDLRTKVTAEIDEVDHLDSKLQLVIYQICKEALANAAHHARAKNIRLSVKSEGGIVSLSVEDDGIGFDTALQKENHFGLLIMRERAESLGGSLYVDSSPGVGTTIAAQFGSRT